MSAEDGAGGNEERIEALSGVLRALLRALDALAFVGRRLHPPRLATLVAEVAGVADDLRAGVAAFAAVDWPDHQAGLVRGIEASADNATLAFDGLRQAATDPDGLLQAYRALRYVPRAQEALYPLAAHLPPVSRFFLDQAGAADQDLQARLAAGAGGADIGVMHANNQKHERGGFSLYVPETYRAGTAHPVVVALHGGSGHGRGFLWTWLRHARARGVILVSPTSVGGTWSLMQPEIDTGHIAAILAHVRANWSIDEGRIMLTGMSDGGTFSYLCGLAEGATFSHLAPISAGFQPLLLEFIDRERLAGLPIRLTHGALDWMFPVDIARAAEASLSAAGAQVDYREIAELSHAYPAEENTAILDWFLGPR